MHWPIETIRRIWENISRRLVLKCMYNVTLYRSFTKTLHASNNKCDHALPFFCSCVYLIACIQLNPSIAQVLTDSKKSSSPSLEKKLLTNRFISRIEVDWKGINEIKWMFYKKNKLIHKYRINWYKFPK